jgi:hypothetical protein
LVALVTFNVVRVILLISRISNSLGAVQIVLGVALGATIVSGLNRMVVAALVDGLTN